MPVGLGAGFVLPLRSVLISRLARAAVLSMGVFVSGCCQPNEAPTGGSDDSSPQRKMLVQEDPEPAGTGFKPLKPTCIEPVVKLSLAQSHPDAADLVEFAREFVRTNPDFASPTINYAEPDPSGAALLLARCPDSDTANRLARKIKTQSRSMHALPVCGFASSGWTSARRTLQLP